MDVQRAGSGEPVRQEGNATNCIETTLEEEIERLLRRAKMLRDLASLPILTEEQELHASLMRAIADAYEQHAYEMASEIEDEDWEDWR